MSVIIDLYCKNMFRQRASKAERMLSIHGIPTHTEMLLQQFMLLSDVWNYESSEVLWRR